MHPQLARSVSDLNVDIPLERAERLSHIASWIKAKQHAQAPVHLVFICTHNSRRSQFAQAWSAAIASGAGLKGIHTWSAGTEATSVAPTVIQELERAGFQVEDDGEGTGEFILTHSEDAEPLVLHSKTIDDPENPANGFAAIMVCGDADGNCPFVAGADVRFSLPYPDPKAHDGTADEADAYRTCSERIASEMQRLIALVRA